MTAHAHLAQAMPDGRIRALYVHHAEPEARIGPILVAHYPTTEQVTALLDQGDMSLLSETPERSAVYRRHSPAPETPARLYPGTGALLEAADTSSCIYLFRGEQWYLALHLQDEWYPLKANGYVAWHGPVATLVEEMVSRAAVLKRPFEQDEVIGPLWDAGYGVMLHLDEHFKIHRNTMFKPRLWTVRRARRASAAAPAR